MTKTKGQAAYEAFTARSVTAGITYPEKPEHPNAWEAFANAAKVHPPESAYVVFLGSTGNMLPSGVPAKDIRDREPRFQEASTHPHGSDRRTLHHSTCRPAQAAADRGRAPVAAAYAV